jgi:exonuclease SbcD
MRILHTSDWHLGHQLRDIGREREHAAFLAWLLDTIGEQRVDSLLISGDVFHTANPPAHAQAAWYRFLAAARARHRDLDIVVIGGNHDSAARLDAPVPLLDAFRIHVVGGVPRAADGTIDADRMAVPLTDRAGNVAAWVAAVPYVRRADLLGIAGDDTGGDPLAAGIRELYRRVVEAARKKRWLGQALLAMGHFTLSGARQSDASERPILGGLGALPRDVFPADLAYVALGHLHLAQPVGADNVRYAGSPIPLSMGEADYENQVVLVEIDGPRFLRTSPLRVPRAVDLIRIGPVAVGDALLQIAALPPRAQAVVAATPLLEVTVALGAPDASVRRRVEEAVADRAVRLVALRIEALGGTDAALADAVVDRALSELDPIDVFRRRYAQEHEGEPRSDLLDAFAELLDGLRSEEAA